MVFILVNPTIGTIQAKPFNFSTAFSHILEIDH